MNGAAANLPDPKRAQRFRFVRRSYRDGVAELAYAFDDGAEMLERIVLPDAPAQPAWGTPALERALELLHLIAGVSYYKAGVPPQIAVEPSAPSPQLAALLQAVYEHGLGEFAYQNRLDLVGKIAFPASPRAAPASAASPASAAPGGSRRTLVPIGGGKDSLVSVEALRSASEPTAAVWVGNSELIRAVAEQTGLPLLNIGRELSPQLFALNRAGAWNGHIPVTAINSAILLLAAVVYGFDAIAFSNERSASSATLETDGREVNHQWSKGYAFEHLFADYVQSEVAPGIAYFSLLRPFSELAVTRQFARLTRYHAHFSSCNRNFKILGARPESRWCGQCPKCHFVFLALAPFLPKSMLLPIFGRNLLDDATLAPAFDALLEWHAHKPFECVGEALESRAALYALTQRAEWREDAIVARFEREILPHLDAGALALEPLLQPAADHRIPARLKGVLDALR